MQSEGIYGKLRVLVAFRLVFVSILLIAFFLLQLGYIFSPYPTLLFFLISFIYFLNVIYLILLKRQRINPVVFGYFQLVCDVILEIIIIMLTGGIESWFTIIMLLTVIASAMVLGKRAGYLIATLAGILYGTVIDLQFYGIIPISYSSGLAEKDFLYNIVINLLAVYLTAYLIGHLTMGLEATQKSLREKSLDLKELSQFHSDVIENIPSGLFSVDLYGNVRLFNRAAEEITGISSTAAVEFNINEIFNFVSLPINPARYHGVIDTGKGERIIGMSISVHMDQKDEPVGYIGTFQDLTDIVRLENEIKKKEKFAAIGELSANIAHEIRNPLASIKGSIEMIKEGEISEPDKERLMNIALQEMTRLNSIITNFLNYSNPKPVTFKECDIGNLLSSTMTLTRASHRELSEITFHSEIEQDVIAMGDEDKLRQVLWNLISNAIDAVNGKGTVSISAGTSNGKIRIEVRDTGYGIERDDLERIFYPFFTTKREGTGLGLAIAYRIIEEHHGSITVSSTVGEGTTFTIELPLDTRPAELDEIVSK